MQPQDTWTSLLSSAPLNSLAMCTDQLSGFFERWSSSVLAELIFILAVSHASAKLFYASWSPDSVEECKTKSSANSVRLICHFQLWHTHQLGCISRSNSCKQCQGEVTKRTLAGIQHRHRTVLIACHLPENKSPVGRFTAINGMLHAL